MAKLTGGKKTVAVLREIAARLDRAKNVEVGFLENATYDDGTPVAYIAAINEFGGTFDVPERQVTVYRKLNKNGEFARGGRFVKKSVANVATTHVSPAHKITIPSRPFFRTTIAEHQAEWGPQLGALVTKNGYDADKALAAMGQVIVGEIRQGIVDMNTPPNAPSTLRRKKGAKPLVDTGHMLNSVDSEVL